MARGTNQSPKRKGMSYTKFGYIFIAPFIIVYCLFSLYPLFNTFWYSATNMKSTTADFWGFDDKEVYYDRYLDLYTAFHCDESGNEAAQTNFKNFVGVDATEYLNTMRAFFAAQKVADDNAPLDKTGIKAIVNSIPSTAYTDKDGNVVTVSQATLDLVNKCYEDNTLEYMTADAMAELIAWKAAFTSANSEANNLQSNLSSINKTVDGILNPVVVEASEDEEVVEITYEDIATSEIFVEFVDSFASLDLDENQTALINYLDAYLAAKAEDGDAAATTVAEYLTLAKETPATMLEPSFYYVVYHMANTNNAKYMPADAEKLEKIEPIIDDAHSSFVTDLQTYLAKNEWPNVINGTDGVSSIADYAAGEKDLTADDEALNEAVAKLNDYGIIDKVQLVVEDGTLVPDVKSEDAKNKNVIYGLTSYSPLDTPTEEFTASFQIGKINTYYGDSNRKMITKFDVDKYITFNGSFNIKKYNEFKKVCTLSDGRTLNDIFTLSFYEKLDKAVKDDCVATNKQIRSQAKEDLSAAQKIYNDAKAAGATKEELLAIQEDVDTAKGELRKANEKIGYPIGLFNSKSMDAKSEYIVCGFENFNKIFASKQARDTILGAFVTTFILWVIGFVPQIALALLLSAWFTDTKLKLKGLGLMKALMYLPNVITAVTIAIFFRKIFMYSTNEAALPPSQIILRKLGDSDGYNFFQKPWPTRLIVCFINFWMWYGNTMIVLIAGITSINESLYESAQIDGANSFQTYTKITMPLLRPILLYTMVTSMIGGLQMFDIPQNLNMNSAPLKFNGTSIKSTRTVLMYVNDMAFGQAADKQVGIASATSVILFFVTIVLSVLIFYLMRDKDAAKAAKAKKLARKAGAAK